MIRYNYDDTGCEAIAIAVESAFEEKVLPYDMQNFYIYGIKATRQQDYYLSTRIPYYRYLALFLKSKGLKVGIRGTNDVQSLGIHYRLRMDNAGLAQASKVVNFILLGLSRKILYQPIQSFADSSIALPLYEDEVAVEKNITPNPDGITTQERVDRAVHEGRIVNAGFTAEYLNEPIISASARLSGVGNPLARLISIGENLERHGFDFKFHSSRDRQVIYTAFIGRESIVVGDYEGGTCSCPGWIHNRNGNRTCYHTRCVAEILRNHNGDMNIVRHLRTLEG